MRAILHMLGFLLAVAYSTQEVITPPVIQLSSLDGLTLVGERPRRLSEDEDAVINDGSVSVTYSYVCEAEGACDLPSATAADFWDTQVNVTEKDYQLMDDGNITEIGHCCDTSFPSTYEIRYDAVDRAGNRAKQVVINLFVRDTKKPILELCNEDKRKVEAGGRFRLCSQSMTAACGELCATAHDNSDGDISSKVVVTLEYNGRVYSDNGIATAGFYGPNDLSKHTGIWKFVYTVSDKAGNTAMDIRWVYVKDTKPPVITLHGSNPIVHECTQPYVDPGGVAEDQMDGSTDTVKIYGGKRRSCLDILMDDPNAPSGEYWIQSSGINSGSPLTVYCDMETDRGGYTYLKIDQGISVNKYSHLEQEYDSCQQLGLQIAIWRTENQVKHMLTHFGTHYLKVAGGIVGKQAAEGVDLTTAAMNSGWQGINQYYESYDKGTWFLRETPFAEPNGDYTAGCYLGMFGFNPSRFNDDMCQYSTGTHYICSTNDKGGMGVLPEMVDGIATGYPPVNLVGMYDLSFRAVDAHGNDAMPRHRQVQVVDTIEPVIHLLPDSCGILWEVREVYATTLRDLQGNRKATCPNYLLCIGTGADEVLLLDDPGASCQDTCDEAQVRTTQRSCNPSHLPGTNPAMDINECVFGCSPESPLCENEVCPSEAEMQARLVGTNDDHEHCETASSGGQGSNCIKATWDRPFNPTEPGTYVRTYECTDSSGNKNDKMTRTWIFIDDFAPLISIIGDNPYYIEAMPDATYVELGAHCTDKQDCDDGSNCLDHTITNYQDPAVNPKEPGNYRVYYTCVDSDDMKAPQIYRSVEVVDTHCPTMELLGEELVTIEAGFKYVDPVPGATAYDINCACSLTDQITIGGDTVDFSRAFYSYGSCLEILKFARLSKFNHGEETIGLQSGDYFITVKPQGRNAGQPHMKLRVYCDMETDDGGYTFYRVDDGFRTASVDYPNSCSDVGLQMMVPRTEEHFDAAIKYFGTKYFQIVPGIYGTVEGKSYIDYAMNSNSPAARDWKAVDGGPWFIRSDPYHQPSGDYQKRCWLLMHGWTKTLYKFDDSYCDFNAVDYLCSTNDKGGLPGVLPGPVCDGTNAPCRMPVENHVAVSGPYPEGAESGKYIIKYHVQDWAGNAECSTPARTVIVKDTLAPRLYLHYDGQLLVKTSAEGTNTDGIGIGGERNFHNLTDLVTRRGEQGLSTDAQGRTIGYAQLNDTKELVSEFDTPYNEQPQRRLFEVVVSEQPAVVWLLAAIGTVCGFIAVAALKHADRSRQQMTMDIIDL